MADTGMVSRKSFQVRMAVEDLARLDRGRGTIPRERFVREAVTTALDRAEGRPPTIERVHAILDRLEREQQDAS